MATINTAAVQLKLNPSSEEAVIKQAAKLVETAARRGAGLICLPEHWLLGKIIDEDNTLYNQFCDLAKKWKANINLGGIYERSKENRILFVSTMVGANGEILGKQPKVHLLSRERKVAEPGSSFEPIQLNGVRVGIMVCHDVVFPESARTLVLKGAEMLLCPSLILESGVSPWHLYVTARALENRVPIVAPNAVLPPTFNGHSLIVDFKYLLKDDVVLPVKHVVPKKTKKSTLLTRKIDTKVMSKLRSERLKERIILAYEN